MDQANLQVNGNQVINSTDKTTEIPLNLTVNTNNKTGYTATLNSETDETALVNNDSTTNTKINSISSTGPLGGFSNNTWGVKVGYSTNFLPIPKLTAPMNVRQTTWRTYSNDTNSIKIGMKLSDSLESGRYTNKLIFSILTNNYDPIAIMMAGDDFNTKLKSLETTTNKIEHFKKSTVTPDASMNVVNIEGWESDYEIKLWLNPTEKTAYYYAEPEKVYLSTYLHHMFFGMSNLTTLDVSHFDTSKATNMNGMFSYMLNLTTLDLSNFDTSKVTDMRDMFSDMHSLTSLDISNFDTSKVTDMCQMFVGMSNLTTLDVSHFDTSKVTNMYAMFSSARSLTTLDVSHFDTSKVTDIGAMFGGLSNLTTLNVSNFDTSKVTNMEYMFSDMYSLTTLNVSNFDTSKVTNMEYMFSDMYSLTTLNVSNFDTSKVTNMNGMFSYMPNLTTLDLSNFDTSKVTKMNYMFSLRDRDSLKDKLEKIYVNNDFNTANLTNTYQMFMNRKKLRGGNGSYLTDPSTANKTWLRIDDPAHGRPGYFTRKP